MSAQAIVGAASAAPVVAIVPCFNGAALLPACLGALLATGGDDLRIVVVDDGSSDASVAVAREWASRSGGRLRAMLLARNHGFAGAVGRAVESVLASADAASVLVFVNQDCIVSPGWLEPLLAALVDPAVAVAGARLLDADGVTLQHAGASIETNALTTHVGRGSTDAAAWREMRDVDYVCGALLAMRASTWREFGPFDEGYAPAYYEEVDFCVRARRAGKRVVYVPTSQARHLEASGADTAASLFLTRYHRSRLRFVVRLHAADVGAARWFVAEARWLLAQRRWKDVAPVLAAYARVPGFVVEQLSERVASRRRAAAAAPTVAVERRDAARAGGRR